MSGTKRIVAAGRWKKERGGVIVDVNLGVTGCGHLLLSKTQMAVLRVGTWFGSWRPDGGGQGSRGEGPE